MRCSYLPWLLVAGVALGCFDERDVGEARHACGECLPCERCVSAGTSLPVCLAEPRVGEVCGADGHPHWVDSCGEPEEIARTCVNSVGCSEGDAGVRCECSEHWQGELCDECPSNWDPLRGCAECAGRWTGENCGGCEGNWDPAVECNACRPHFVGDACDVCDGFRDLDADCDACLPNADPDDDCQSCLGNWDPTTACSTCKNHWVDRGDDCGTCPDGWDPAGDCLAVCGNDRVDNGERCDDADRPADCFECEFAEFEVNGAPAVASGIADVAMQSDGTVIVVWEDSEGDADGTAVRMARYDPTGSRVGPTRVVNQYKAGDQGAPRIAVAADDSFAVAWVGDRASLSRGVSVQWYAGDATRDGPELEGTAMEDVEIAMRSDGTLVVVGTQRSPSSSILIADVFDRSGVTMSPALEPSSSDDHTVLDVAGGPDGSYVVMYRTVSIAASYPLVRGWHVASGGAQVSLAQTRESDEIAIGNAAATYVESGAFIVAWSMDVAGSAWRIHARGYNALAGALGMGARFAHDGAVVGSVALAATGDGGFALAFDDEAGAPDRAVLLQRFDDMGVVAGDLVRIDRRGGASHASPRVATGFGNRIAWAWMDGERVYAQRLTGADGRRGLRPW